MDVVQADLVHPLFHRLQQAVDILVSSRHPGEQLDILVSLCTCAQAADGLMPSFWGLLMSLSSTVSFRHHSPGISSVQAVLQHHISPATSHPSCNMSAKMTAVHQS